MLALIEFQLNGMTLGQVISDYHDIMITLLNGNYLSHLMRTGLGNGTFLILLKLITLFDRSHYLS
jgi:hypothetical protein